MYTQSISPIPAAALPPELLIVDAEATTAAYIAALRDKFHVAQASTPEAALRALERTSPAFVVTDLALPNGGGEQVCRAAKALKVPATVLVTTEQVEQVPNAIEAGCDAVLLKPFAPNLLFARLGRLLRARATELRFRALRQSAKSEHLRHRSGLLLAGTNQHWPNTHCPYCMHAGVTSFEFTSYRRAWYACMDCKKVWIARRQE
jgi:DNA-binding response OmpR family regulator